MWVSARSREDSRPSSPAGHDIGAVGWIYAFYLLFGDLRVGAFYRPGTTRLIVHLVKAAAT
ncbi:hypothetical protein DEM27_27680 [Metarhizobium album]|uniref:Uncharacterized protein n=1 Tax=Metarhizobium album TaxID=2182425 RepID=A0A2U2DIM4_9HYPH|nr:hypothetical protein DEM27_27680 [Rhizobium album]